MNICANFVTEVLVDACRNIKAGTSGEFFSIGFENFVTPGFASHPESFEGNRVVLIVVVVVVGTRSKS